MAQKGGSKSVNKWGWMFMILYWLLVISLVVFSFSKLLRSKP